MPTEVGKPEKIVMSKFILGRKGPMTQMFTEDGVCIPVTLIEAGPCWVTALKTKEADGYDAVQLGFEVVREKVVSKPCLGHLAKAGVQPLRFLREMRLAGPSDGYEVGGEVKADSFEAGDMVDIVGTSKGRGFAGVMKRYNFAGGRMTHGGMARRRPGAIGQCAYPGKVFKGKRMAGHYGNARHTTKNLEIVGVDVERNVLMVRGAVPGTRGGFVYIRQAKSGPARAASAK